MTHADVKQLEDTFSGAIIQPGDDSYEQARVTYMVKDAQPAVIAKATNSQDIAAAITYARTAGLEISVRSGGHSAAGFSTNTDGLVLDLSQLRAIELLDKARCLVRIGAGAHWGDVARKLDDEGLALSSGDTVSVGIGGLTLGGGIGWLVRKYGYAIDSLVATEVILADGSIVRASETEHSDLFWALRGGGGNFGVVSYFEFMAHPLGKVVQHTVTYDTTAMAKAITGWRDHLRTAPEELTSFLTLMPGFGDMPPQIMIMSCYADDDTTAAERLFEPLRQLGDKTSDTTVVIPYAEMLAEAHPPEGVEFIVKSMYMHTLGDEIVATLVDMCTKPDSPIVQLRIIHGAIDRVDPLATAMAHRGNESFMFVGFPLSPGAPNDQRQKVLKKWQRLAVHGSGAYSNFVSTNTNEDVASIYPPTTYQRLAQIKKQYDPDNIFHHNFNVKPA